MFDRSFNFKQFLLLEFYFEIYDLLSWNFISRYTLHEKKTALLKDLKFWLDTDQESNFVELSK